MVVEGSVSGDCCYFQYLSNYGFQNKASSWRSNLNNNDVRVWNSGPSPDVLLWCSDTQSTSSNVGTADNDRADYFYIQSSDNYC
jgi:hypothetical protein